jgi:uncharacterized repeat protein (TIGR01451 family)
LTVAAGPFFGGWWAAPWGPVHEEGIVQRLKRSWFIAPVVVLLAAAAACAPPPGQTTLSVEKTAPIAAFPGQEVTFTIEVTNTGESVATGVEVVDTLPADGAFVSSNPAGTPAAPTPGADYTIALGDVAPGATAVATVTWTVPEGTGTLSNSAIARAANAPATAPDTAEVEYGIETSCDPCGVTAAGTGLRNRDSGTISITGVPEGAVVGRAVLVWGILHDGNLPPNTITLQGTQVTADLTATVSGTLCWGDTATIGYAADVTSLVTGNGDYTVSDPPRGTTRVDADPNGALPYTDGASLLVFYVGGGSNRQVISDFSYDTNTDADAAIAREFEGINSVGGAADLILAGPDGQGIFSETIDVVGNGMLTLENTFDGSDPQAGPSFDQGNLWDTDSFDVSSVLPAGQTTLSVQHQATSDCIGVGAAVLSVDQNAPV